MPAATLARFVLLEARRSGLPWLALACIALSVGLAAFLSQVALTESRALQAARAGDRRERRPVSARAIDRHHPGDRRRAARRAVARGHGGALDGERGRAASAAARLGHAHRVADLRAARGRGVCRGARGPRAV